MSALARSAKIVEDLVDFDGPQLILLKTNRNHHMFAIAIKLSDMQEPFFACEVPDHVYDQYFSEKADLHFAFNRAYGKNYYVFDLAALDKNSVFLKRASQDEISNPANWPLVGFFARSHTTQFNRSRIVATIRKFKIDGKWGTNDFSRFHGKMSDLYALFGVLDRLDGSHAAEERGFVRQLIQERFWQRGGSYGGFYDSLIERNLTARLTPLEVAKIQYASPGELSLRGNKKVLSEVADIVAILDEKLDELKWDYRSIYGTLKKEGLLSAKPTAEFSTPAMRDFVRKVTREFANKLELEKVDDIYRACDQNVLIFAKVILSIFRRAEDLYRFHAEGRVQRAD